MNGIILFINILNLNILYASANWSIATTTCVVKFAMAAPMEL